MQVQEHKRQTARPYCIGHDAVAPLEHHEVAVKAVLSAVNLGACPGDTPSSEHLKMYAHEGRMSAHDSPPQSWRFDFTSKPPDPTSSPDSGRLDGDAALQSATQQRNLGVAKKVRELLAARDVVGFSALIADFTTLVEEGGPLAFLRFEEGAFDTCIREHLDASLSSDAEAFAEALHLKCIDPLCTPHFIEQLQTELRVFLAQPYVPSDDRLAATAALLTLAPAPHRQGVKLAELPTLYAIFRVQLVDWLNEAGAAQLRLADMAQALAMQN